MDVLRGSRRSFDPRPYLLQAMTTCFQVTPLLSSARITQWTLESTEHIHRLVAFKEANKKSNNKEAEQLTKTATATARRRRRSSPSGSGSSETTRTRTSVDRGLLSPSPTTSAVSAPATCCRFAPWRCPRR